jgi:uncharacterized membrane protein
LLNDVITDHGHPLALHTNALREVVIRPYAVGVATGIVVFLLVLAIVARLHLRDGYPSVLAVVVCSLAALILAMRWPERPWRWAVCIGSGFWFFLGLVALALREMGRSPRRPLEDAVAITLAGYAAAWLGSRLAARMGRWL